MDSERYRRFLLMKALRRCPVMARVERLERSTVGIKTRCANQLRHTPIENGSPGRA